MKDESKGQGEAKAKGPGNTGPSVKGLTGGVKSTAPGWTATVDVQLGASAAKDGKATGRAGAGETQRCSVSAAARIAGWTGEIRAYLRRE